MALQTTTIQQYDWLVKANSHQTCLQHTFFSNSVSGVSLDGKLDFKQVFDLVGFQFSWKEGRVRSAVESWQTLNANPETSSRTHMPGPAAEAPDRVDEKQVHLGRLHMRPIQWHWKNSWRVPESPEKVTMCYKQGTKLSPNSFGTTGLTTCGSYWSIRKFISPICKHENEKLLHGYKNIYYTGQ